MKKSIEKAIELKIVLKSDINKIWSLFDTENKDSTAKGNHSRLKIYIECDDETSYESESNEFLEENNVIDSKKINLIRIDYFDYKEERGMDVYLNQGHYKSYFKVSGNNSDWVDAKFTNLVDIFHSVRPQDSWLVKYKKIIYFIAPIIIGKFLYLFLDYFIYSNLSPIQNSSDNLLGVRNFFDNNQVLVYVICFFLYWLLGLPPVKIIYKKLLLLYPSIEFDFGPEFKKLLKIRRRKILVFF